MSLVVLEIIGVIAGGWMLAGALMGLVYGMGGPRVTSVRSVGRNY